MTDVYAGTAHLDGFRVEEVFHDDKTEIVIRLYADGKRAPELCDEFSLIEYDHKEYTPEQVAASASRVKVLAEGMCVFLNAGGDRVTMRGLVRRMLDRVPDVSPANDLVSVHLPAGGVTYYWDVGRDAVLKAVHGRDAFAEYISRRQYEEEWDLC